MPRTCFFKKRAVWHGAIVESTHFFEICTGLIKAVFCSSGVVTRFRFRNSKKQAFLCETNPSKIKSWNRRVFPGRGEKCDNSRWAKRHFNRSPCIDPTAYVFYMSKSCVTLEAQQSIHFFRHPLYWTSCCSKPQVLRMRSCDLDQLDTALQWCEVL